MGNRILKYAVSPLEAAALNWMKGQMGWSQTVPEELHL